MGNGDGVYDKWRKNAAREYQDDRYTVVFNELVAAWTAYRELGEMLAQASGHAAYFNGMVRAYELLTGDDNSAILRQVADATRRLVPS